MPDQDKSKRWRLRWSVRTLVILVTLVCAYLACWGPTKTWGHRDVAMVEFGHYAYYEGTIEAKMPLVLVANDTNFIGYRRYYFWFFGYIAKLPYDGWPD